MKGRMAGGPKCSTILECQHCWQIGAVVSIVVKEHNAIGSLAACFWLEL
jgi:hypothetical protein